MLMYVISKFDKEMGKEEDTVVCQNADVNNAL